MKNILLVGLVAGTFSLVASVPVTYSIVNEVLPQSVSIAIPEEVPVAPVAPVVEEEAPLALPTPYLLEPNTPLMLPTTLEAPATWTPELILPSEEVLQDTELRAELIFVTNEIEKLTIERTRLLAVATEKAKMVGGSKSTIESFKIYFATEMTVDVDAKISKARERLREICESIMCE